MHPVHVVPRHAASLRRVGGLATSASSPSAASLRQARRVSARCSTPSARDDLTWRASSGPRGRRGLLALCRGASRPVQQQGGRGRGGRDSSPGRGGRGRRGRGGFKLREYKVSDGEEHLGSALEYLAKREFPGPPPDTGEPLRVLPIGGLGEIGMNCMLVGSYDRYIVIDAGLMFPDFQDLGMQKILPDTSFLHQWRDKIEALVITHGHEDHIGAMPWVVPALDPSTPIYASSFVMRLIKRRLTEYNLFDESRFHVFDMNQPFSAGPFEVEPVRVTHSIPDCCGLIMRSEHGTIVHTGDWKIDETPQDGLEFDRTTFDKLAKEHVVLMMSDSTNVLSPGRTVSEKVVEQSLMRNVAAHHGKGRVIVTQFASNVHRLYSVKKAADAAGRKIAFIGMSLNHYLDAAHKDGRAPFDPRDVIQAAELDDYDPNEVLIVTTGSQAEPRAALSLASREASHMLKIMPTDRVLYSAKVIPGNDTRVVKMLNSLSAQGATVVQGRSENLHVSGHAYQDELAEVLQLVKPQHFLPVHGEYSFLCEHAQLARERAGVQHTSVIKNGTMLGVHSLLSRNQFGKTSSLASVVGEANLVNFYNDGNKGTGTAQEMAIAERTTMAFEGMVVLALDINRAMGTNLAARCRLTTRGMWTDQGKLLAELYDVAEGVVGRMSRTASLALVERQVIDAVRKACIAFNNKKPEVICIAHEHDPRVAHVPEVQANRAAMGEQARPPPSSRNSEASSGAAARPWAQARAHVGSAPARLPDEPSEGEQSAQDEKPSEGEQIVQDKPPVKEVALKQQLLDASKRARASRKTASHATSRRTADAANIGIPGPPQQPLPKAVLEQRKRANPRDNLNKENDPDYG